MRAPSLVLLLAACSGGVVVAPAAGWGGAGGAPSGGEGGASDPGEGGAPAALEAFVLEPASLSLAAERGQLACGQVAIRNTGTIELMPVQIRAEAALPAEPDRLRIDAAPALYASIPPGEEASFEVCHAPGVASRPLDASILVASAGAIARLPVSLPVGSFGSAVCLRLSPTHLDLGRVAVGAAADGGVSLVNCGTGTIEIERVLDDDPFRIDAGALPRRLASGDALGIHVTFRPAREGRVEGALEVWLARAMAPLVVNLAGEGVGP